MSFSLKLFFLLWPLIPFGLGAHFHRKQNSSKAWTGGPISWPKSLWLAYTVTNWFLLPLVFLLPLNNQAPLRVFYVVHLVSWWIRGPLELIMIYKWLNWSPRYGISHDLLHFLTGAGILCVYLTSIDANNLYLKLAVIFAVVILLATLAEAWFAWLFLRARSPQEESENIYFASDDPKWIFINRATLSVVIFVYGHLILQSAFVLYDIIS